MSFDDSVCYHPRLPSVSLWHVAGRMYKTQHRGCTWPIPTSASSRYSVSCGSSNINEVREALKAVKAESETKATAPMQPPQPPLLPPRSLLPPHRPLPTKARAFARGAEPRLHRLLPAAVGYG